MSHKHKKRFGQNFLNNQQVIERIVRAIHPYPDDHMVEIGPGEAALTVPLLKVVKRLEIIEIDNDLIAPLTQKFGHLPNFHLHHTDALTFDYATLLQNEEEKLRVVGNLPYNISSPLIFHLLTYADRIQDMHFMLQKEVVDRMTAEPGSKTYGRLSVMLQYRCDTQHLFKVGPKNFTPPPKVDSAIARLTPWQTLPNPAENNTDFAELVKAAFAHKRKTLRNNLKGLLNSDEIEATGIAPSMRAEQLPVADFVTLANAYTQLKKMREVKN